MSLQLNIIYGSNDIFNSSPPSATYLRLWIGWALVQIMACRLFAAKPLSKPMLGYCQLALRNKLPYNFNQNRKFFIHENASENIICEKAAILYGGDELIGLQLLDRMIRYQFSITSNGFQRHKTEIGNYLITCTYHYHAVVLGTSLTFIPKQLNDPMWYFSRVPGDSLRYHPVELTHSGGKLKCNKLYISG